MNPLKIPGSPNWYLSSVFTCAPDNTIVYAATGNNLNVIYPTDFTEPANIHTTFKLHGKKIVAIDINHATWGNPNKLVATVGDDKLVKLLDLDRKTYKKHSEHLNDQNDSLVAVSIAGDRVISVSENGIIVIWQPELTLTKRITNLFMYKVKVTCMSSCPHAKSITAFGLSKGTVIIADLRNPPRILYKMTKHQESIIGFSWCPAPINIFKSNTNSKDIITIKATTQASKEICESDKSEICNVVEEDTVLKETDNIIESITNVEVPKYGIRKQNEYKKVDKKNLWTNLNYGDSDEEVEEQRHVHVATRERNFLQECQNLRKTILGDSDEGGESPTLECEPELELEPEPSQSYVEDKENINSELLSEAMGNISLNKPEHEIDLQDDSSSVNVNTFASPQRRFIMEEDSKEYLLASVCLRGDICVWSTSNGRLSQKITSFAKKNKNTRNSNNSWACIYWLRPDMLLTSSCDNKLYSMQFITGDEFALNPSKIFNTRLIHSDHNQVIFAITCPFKLYTSYEVTTLDDLKGLCVWTTSKDRLIISTDLGPERKTLISYPTFGTTIVYMALSSIDPTKLAMGLSDGVIRIWDLSLNQTHVILMTKNQEKNRQKISYLDWHPVKENLLAYATVEGQLGIIDVKNPAKSAVKFSQYHSKHIYCIQWAPFPFEEQVYGLYSSSGGQLVVHHEKKSEPMKIDIDNCHVSTFSWNEEYSILAVGSREGQVKLLAKNFSVYETFYMQKKTVQCIQWHPLSTTNDTGLSPFANYLAVATNEKDIYIYQCLHVDEKNANNSSELKAVLKGQVGAVKHVCWSPHEGELIVAATEYGMANVYNIVTKTLLASCRCNSMFTGIVWSPLHKDLILSGNYGHTLTIWNLIHNDPMFTIVDDDEETKQENKKKNEEDSDDDSVNSENVGAKKKKKAFTLTKVCRLQRMKHIELYKKLLETYDKKSEQDDSDNESASGSDDNDDEAKPKSTVVEDEKKPLEAVQIFGNRKDALSILQHEQENHLSKENWDQMINIGLWRGDPQKTIETLMAQGTINQWMIQVAPIISHQLYSELCLKYADKLCESGNGAEASNYYLLCHQVLKAIDALCSSNMYRDALILAKCRLPTKDPKIQEIYEKWLKNSIIVGNYEEAAQCYIKLNKLSEAGELLSKRANKEVLDVAAELAKRSNNTDLLNAINQKMQNLNRVENTTDSSVLHVSESRFSAMMDKLKDTTDTSSTALQGDQ